MLYCMKQLYEKIRIKLYLSGHTNHSFIKDCEKEKNYINWNSYTLF